MRSRKSIVDDECLCVNCRLVWKELSSRRKESSVSAESVQIMKMSSMYRVISNGCLCCVCRKFLRITDIKMLATVDENGVPIAVPLICWKVRLSNVK